MAKKVKAPEKVGDRVARKIQEEMKATTPKGVRQLRELATLLELWSKETTDAVAELFRCIRESMEYRGQIKAYWPTSFAAAVKQLETLFGIKFPE